jgi:hypothetical protein
MSQNVVTDTDDTPLAFEQWEVSPAQAWAADCLARCESQTATAEKIGVSLRQLQRWCAYRPFRQYVRGIQRGILEGYYEEFQLRVAESLIIMGQVFRGEIKADDGRVGLAHDTLKSTIYRMATSGDLQPAETIDGPADIPRLGAPIPAEFGAP